MSEHMGESTNALDPRLRVEPRCPSCQWPLGFRAHEQRWVASCRNTNCARGDVLPPRPWESETLALVDSDGTATAKTLAAAFGLQLTAASMRLKTLYSEGALKRERQPHGNGFIYERNGAHA